MNHPIYKFLLATACTLVLSQAAYSNAWAEAHGVSCSGCSESQMNRAATRATQNGTVYVFNDRYRKVNKYSVFTETIDVRPYTSWTTAIKLTTEWKLKRDWKNFLEAVETLGGEETIPLPSDFPVRSVAGAILDPQYATTAIENFLLGLPANDQLVITLNSLIGRINKLKLPIIDLQDIVRAMTLRFEFPDGSTMDFSIEFTVNQVTLKARTELTPEGNARTADGEPAPTSAVAFRGRNFEDNGGSLIEWIELARFYGVNITGGGSGLPTTMRCWVSGSEIHCVVATRD